MDPSSEFSTSWQVATAIASALIGAHDRIPGRQDWRLKRFGVWKINPATGEAGGLALLGMALHLTAVDAGAAGPREARRAVESTTLTAVASLLENRPAHDLLAGLPATTGTPGAPLIRLLIHSAESPAVLALDRLSLTTRRLLLTLTDGRPARAQTIGEVLA
ncbi:hypothetical protein OG730_04330 [Streptomyces sp. NBC_01298]|uniref:hypothetical protein n=1 Tax=Streptomyces sp. NBC_01298 TaxID=2903817 RepID=UPI002E0E924F|nr:hypothetical protein OG730_04330 [Streptomyces sp. NBC_01298]